MADDLVVREYAFPQALADMQKTMREAAPPWWNRRIIGTPLENDIPVRAATLMMKKLLERDAQLAAMTEERDEYRALMEKEHHGWLDAEAREIAADSCPAGCIGGKILSYSYAPDVFCPHCMTGLRAKLTAMTAERVRLLSALCAADAKVIDIAAQLAAMTAERDRMEIRKEKFRRTTLLARTERDALIAAHAGASSEPYMRIQALTDKLTASEAARERLARNYAEKVAYLVEMDSRGDLTQYGRDNLAWARQFLSEIQALAEPGRGGCPPGCP